MKQNPSAEILLVEDDSILTKLLEYHLEKIVKCPVRSFVNGQDLVKFFSEAKQEKTYLIFLDINMPIMDGWQTLDYLNDFHKISNIFVVILSSSLYPPDEKRAYAYPQVIDYRDKFLERDDFREILSKEPLKSSFALETVS